MYWQDVLFLSSGLTGLSMLIIVGIVSRMVPKKMNNFYGYRTKRSMKSQEAWDFAQLHSNRLMVRVAIFNMVLGFIGFMIGFTTLIGFTISMVGLAISLIYLFRDTEKELKERFRE